jgi:Ca-activated chloride channel family protein
MERVPREVILVIDTSGSMQGSSMEQAKAAVIQALDALTPRDRFNVLEFNSVTVTFSRQTLPATRDNLTRAKAWVAKLVANGGTEMAPALTFALDGTEAPGVLRQVIFMTDGGVGDEEALFRLIAARLGGSRLFTVGIGSAPNGHFMTRAAELGRGTYTYISDVREVGEKMTRLFAKIEAPVLQDVSIRWADGTAVDTFPKRVPDLYLGEPIVVTASAAAFTRTLVVSGTRGNQPWSVALTPSSTGDESTGVGALWARAKIASLMDEITRGAAADLVRPQVVKVALEHHLVSAYTSLVAVEDTPTATAAATRTVMVKASVPQGYTGSLPQTDTPATLELLMGMFALMAAALVFTVGRRV